MPPETGPGPVLDIADGPEPGVVAAAPGSTPRVLIGTDLVAVERVLSLVAEQPGLEERVFTARELAYCTARGKQRADHLAARFAAKEAVMKALGTGASGGVGWTDIEVVNRMSGRPVIRLRGEAAVIAARSGVQHAEISLSHSAGLAMAYAVLVCAAAAA